MTELPGRLGTLAAHHIMTSDLVVLKEDESVGAAAAKLKQHGITGAPVVNEHDMPVGMLSLSDIIQSRTAETGTDEAVTPEILCGDEAHTWELFEHVSADIENAGGETVSQRMSPRLVTVTNDTPLVEVARVMCEGHWHRVAVVDTSGSLCGIVSTMDILAALINTADEVLAAD